MTDAEVADRLLEMREATARRCVEIIYARSQNVDIIVSAIKKAKQTGDWSDGLGYLGAEISAAIKKEFGLED